MPLNFDFQALPECVILHNQLIDRMNFCYPVWQRELDQLNAELDQRNTLVNTAKISY